MASHKAAGLSSDLHGKQLRANLLHKLGIPSSATAQPQQKQTSSRGSCERPIERACLRLGHGARIVQEPLKEDPLVLLIQGDQQFDDGGDIKAKNRFLSALASAFLWKPPAEHSSQDDKKDSLDSVLDYASSLPPLIASQLQVQTTPLHLPDLDVCSHASGSTASCHYPHSHPQHATCGSRRVTFHNTVTLVLIPRRDEYSDRMRAYLWDSTEAVKSNIARNTLEFAADGNNVQYVLEEEQHIRSPETGEFIHPIHFEIARVLREERGLPEAKNVEALLNTL